MSNAPPIPEESLFGRLAVQFGLVTMEQLSQATQLQARLGHSVKLGDVFIEQGWMSQHEVDALLATQEAQRHEAARPSPAAPAAGTEPPCLPASSAQQEALSPAPPSDASSASSRSRAPAVQAPRLDPESKGSRAVNSETLRRFVATALEQGASDLHLHAGAPPQLRLAGSLVDLGDRALTGEETERLAREVLEPAYFERLNSTGQVDCALELGPGEARLRLNVYRQWRGIDLVARLIPARPPTLGDLGLPTSLVRLANFPQGLVLITGPIGCGKSSTLAALLDLINEERSEHIITAEDPIEFVHRPKRCVVNQRQVGVHSQSCAKILRAALREDPDVIALGELRDNESFELALSAAETGHLVFATLHTSRAVATMHRVVGSFPASRQEQVRAQLSESLRAVVSQRLARRADGKGRCAVVEMLMVNKAVAHLIRDNKLHQIHSQMQSGAAAGMQLLENEAERLLVAGVIDAEEARRLGVVRGKAA